MDRILTANLVVVWFPGHVFLVDFLEDSAEGVAGKVVEPVEEVAAAAD